MELLEYTLEDVFGEGRPSFTSQSISADTRRTHEKSYHVDLPSPMKRQRTTVYFAGVEDEFEYTFEDLAARLPVPALEVPKKARAKRYLSSAEPPDNATSFSHWMAPMAAPQTVY
ncbi:hypothetical protein B0H14DRAFT_3477064 [Mycena olivaceomarginata]|nr:hypothetical protein B0H14DRAFT_3477064 [Mycena olivaceomarginata]